MNAQNVRGFVMDVVQEECPYRITGDPVDRADARPLALADRSDASPPKWLRSEVTHVNSSSSSTTFYYFDAEEKVNGVSNALPMDEPANKWADTETKEHFDNRSEAPVSSQFFFLSDFNSLDRCAFGYSHLLKLSTDPVWQVRPRCG